MTRNLVEANIYIFTPKLIDYLVDLLYYYLMYAIGISYSL